MIILGWGCGDWGWGMGVVSNRFEEVHRKRGGNKTINDRRNLAKRRSRNREVIDKDTGSR